MQKIWLKSYPKGVSAEIDVDTYASLRDVFDSVVAEFGARPAYTCMGKSITFAELDRASAAFGAFLQGRGLKKGARVALMMPNILQYPVCLFGILRAGFTVVNTNPLYTPRELEYQLTDSGAEVIVVVENFAHTVQEVVGRTAVKQVVVTSIGEMLGWKGPLIDFVLRHVKKMIPRWRLPGSMRLSEALAEGRRRNLEHVPITHQDIAFLQYTGGTTGVAKGAMLLHRNIIANLLQARAWLKPFLGTEDHIILTPLPLYHIFSLTANCLVFMTLGAKNVLITNPRDIPGFVKEMSRHRFTTFTGGSGTQASLALTKPTGLQNGDVLVAHLAVRGDVHTSMAGPGGWTTVDLINESTSITMGVFSHAVANAASEPASYTFTWTGTFGTAGTIMTFQNGFPAPVTNNVDTTGTGISSRPDLVPGQNGNLPGSERTWQRWFNTAAFTEAPFGRFGTSPRTNAFRLPGIANGDFSVNKTFALSEQRRLEFRTEFFNLTNHFNPDPGTVDRNIRSKTFGAVGGGVQGVTTRVIQLGAKLLF